MIKKILKLLFPPIILVTYQFIHSFFEEKKEETGWFAGYQDYNNVKKVCSDYDSDVI